MSFDTEGPNRNPNSEVDHIEQAKLPTSRKIMYIVSTVVIFIAMCFMLLIVYWMIYPYKTAELDVPVQILNEEKQIAPGETIRMKVVANKYANTMPTRSEFIVCNDGSLTFMTPGPARNLPPGRYTVINENNLLPIKLSEGAVCNYVFRYGYQVNPIREIVKEWESEPFTVVQGGNNGAG